MRTFETKQYRVDPGLGKIHPNCPYSCYEDGHDVKDFVIPPRGYVLSGFKLEPEPDFGSYDGRLIAQFEPRAKTPKTKLNLLLGIIVGILLIAAGIMFYSVFKSNNAASKPKVEPVVIDASSSYLSIKDKEEEATHETESVETVAELVSNENTKVQEIAQTEAPVAEQTPAQVMEEPVVKEEPKKVEQPQVAQNETTQEAKPIIVGDRKTQFKEEFWTLIHNQEKSMRTYHDLYSKYKGDKLRSKEFFYLYLTILENTSNFNAWKANLLRVPASEIKSIRTVSALEQKLEEYE